MKRVILVLIFAVFATSFAEAQRREVNRAERQLNRGGLAEALGHIESAIQDESTKEDAKTWLLHALIHMEIFSSEDPEVNGLVEKPLDKAYESLKKADKLDEAKELLLDIQQGYLILSEQNFNAGVYAFNDHKYGDASHYFFRSFQISETFASTDTTTLYNAALAAELNQELNLAEKHYKRLTELHYDQPQVFASLSNISLAKNDSVQALAYVQMGRERFPDDLNLIFSEANIHIFSGNLEEARETLNLAIAKDPDNYNLYFAFAANYDRMAQDTTYTLDEREFAFREAIKAYEKAINMKENYFDAIYNLGVLYFNEGIRIYEQADENLRATYDFAQYEKDEKRFKDMWLKAQPYLERAKELIEDDDPNLEVVVLSLVQLYARTDQNEKLKDIEELYIKFFGESQE
jgi:Tfp pilus assembly protein PilF